MRECTVTDANKGTLEGRWPITPIPVAVSTVGFSASDQTVISQAVDKWNRHFNTVKGFKIIFNGNPPASILLSSEAPGTTTICPSNGSPGFIQGSEFVRNIVVVARPSWSGDPAVIAQTIRCLNGASSNGLSLFTGAIIEVNYQTFFSTSQQPDLASIVAHELGHLIGLGHGCEFATKPNTPNCNNELSNATITKALMFPRFSINPTTGLGEVRRNLNANDQGRANCLY